MKNIMRSLMMVIPFLAATNPLHAQWMQTSSTNVGYMNSLSTGTGFCFANDGMAGSVLNSHSMRGGTFPLANSSEDFGERANGNGSSGLSMHFQLSADYESPSNANNENFGDIVPWFNKYWQGRDLYGNPIGASSNEGQGGSGYLIQVSMIWSDAGGNIGLGIGAGAFFPMSPAIWLTSIGFGEQSEFKMNYFMTVLNLSLEGAIIPHHLYVSVEPALLSANSTGTLYQTIAPSLPANYSFGPSPAIGWELAVGGEWFVSGPFGIYLKERYRSLTINDALQFSSGSGGAGLNGNDVNLNLSTIFSSFGLMVRF